MGFNSYTQKSHNLFYRVKNQNLLTKGTSAGHDILLLWFVLKQCRPVFVKQCPLKIFLKCLREMLRLRSKNQVYLESVMTTIALLVQGAKNLGEDGRSRIAAFSIA